MAVERAKLEAVLEEKLKGKSLSKNFKSNLAAKLADKIENDEAIDSYLDDRLDILLEASSEADRRATEAANKAKGEQKKEETIDPPKTDTNPPKQEDEMPAWFKPFADKVNTLEQSQKGMTVAQKREALMKEGKAAGLPDFALELIPVTEETDIAEALSGPVAKYTEFAKQNKLAAFGNDAPPAGQPKNANEPSADMRAYLAAKKASAPAAAN